jgi:hypothetical protein
MKHSPLGLTIDACASPARLLFALEFGSAMTVRFNVRFSESCFCFFAEDFDNRRVSGAVSSAEAQICSARARHRSARSVASDIVQ